MIETKTTDDLDPKIETVLKIRLSSSHMLISA